MKTPSNRGRGRPKIYNWERWFMRDRFTLRWRIDYAASQSTMVQAVRTAASKRGLRVHLEDRGTEIIVTVTERPCPAVNR